MRSLRYSVPYSYWVQFSSFSPPSRHLSKGKIQTTRYFTKKAAEEGDYYYWWFNGTVPPPPHPGSNPFFDAKGKSRDQTILKSAVFFPVQHLSYLHVFTSFLPIFLFHNMFLFLSQFYASPEDNMLIFKGPFTSSDCDAATMTLRYQMYVFDPILHGPKSTVPLSTTHLGV